MGAVLRQVPTGTRQIYVLSAGSWQNANPEYVRLALGVPAEIVRVGEINWHCPEKSDLVGFDYRTADGVVSMTVTLPACAYFRFAYTRFNGAMSVNGRLYRNDTMSYELPEAYKATGWYGMYLGRRMTMQVRPNGPARFLIEHGGPNGIAWFDTP